MKYFLIFLVTLESVVSYSQTNDSLSARVILVGDAGALREGRHPVVSAIKYHMHPDEKTTIVFLGDNLYTTGLPDESVTTYARARTVLDSQVAVAAGTKAKVYMIPGNHDWSNGGMYGWDALRRQQSYVNFLKGYNVRFVPEGGCPGPVEIPINDDVVLIVFDSQWWLHTHDKPGIDMDCDCKTEGEFLLQLGELLRKNYLKLVILASHHPFMSNGVHGGYFGIKQHIFPFTDLNKYLYIPLPILGSIYPISRSVFGSPQDISHPNYTNMIGQIKQVIKGHPNVIFANGHDHNLQLLKDDSGFNYVISGGGSRIGRVAKSKKAAFVKASLGYAVLEISKHKDVTARFYAVSIDSTYPSEVFAKSILNFSKLPPLAEDTATVKVPKYKDFFTAPASTQYKNPSGFKKFFLGTNYRKVWATPVKLKVFRLKEEKGGFKIESLGGGKQTKSLNLVDKTGKKWALKTIDKDPDAAIPANFRNTIASEVVQDLISAAFPYGSLIVPPLASAERITHPTPEYFFVPDDPYFGYYRPLFANKICMLEEKDASKDESDTKSSVKVFNEIIEDNDHTVEQEEVVNARLLDIFVADWDRHFDQWKWGVRDTGKGKSYYPIPKDRDQAFFYSNGLLLRWAARKKLPFLKGFLSRIPDINNLGWPAKDFDRLFMNQVDKKSWQNIATLFILKMTDSVINNAVKKLPPEIYPISGQEIANKLINRRKVLFSKSMVYYNFLSRHVNVLGSNKTEYFRVTNEDDKIRVRVLNINDEHDTTRVIYDRLFDPKDTKEIRLFGFGGNDIFDIRADAKSRTRLRVIGGRGVDTFNIKGNIKNYIYDVTTEDKYLSKGKRTFTRFSEDPRVNSFDLNEFQYDITRFPRLNIGINEDDGFMAGLGFWYRKFGFRKTPFASDEKLSTMFSFTQRAFQVHYKGIFTDVIKKTDLLVDAELMDPALNNFFGFGNKTKINKDSSISFYRVRYKDVAVDILAKKKVASVFSVIAGPTFFYYWNKVVNNKDYILGRPGVVGLDSVDVYSQKTYIGGKVGLLLYNLNSELFPTRGINWYTEFTALSPVTSNSHSFTRLQSDMVVYASLSEPAKFVTVIKLGGGKIFSKNFEYFQAMNLGANNFLRGFRKNRFSGNSLAYGSLELRLKLFDSKSYFLPGQVGLVLFNDIGRVWYKNEVSRKWHDAYGGGFYYVPYNMVLVSATVGFSSEERLFNFSLGTKINFTF